MNPCRNCGHDHMQDLGPIGKLAPFFLKRVFGIDLRVGRSPSPFKQTLRNLAAIPNALLARAASPSAFVEVQLCLDCAFIQTRIPFSDEAIMRLYLDYRSPSYNAERIAYEPHYAPIASAVGQSTVEIENRTSALTSFLQRNLPITGNVTMLDYGGSDGKFLPRIPGAKFVYEVSNIEPIAGVARIHDEAALSTYSYVQLAHVVEHVPHPLALVSKVSAFVQPGGHLYVETPQEITDAERERIRLGTSRLDVGIHEHINSYCVPAVTSLLQAAGLEVVAIECTPVDVGWARARHIRALGRKPLA